MEETQFLKILKNNQGIIYKVANSYCINVADRDDLIQEISIQIWRSHKRYNKKFKVSTWIYRIALNTAISFYRKRYRQSSLNKPITTTEDFIEDESNESDSENVKRLYRCIHQLNEFNKALMLLYLDEYSHEEIAINMGISKSNVATKISRIKQQLRKEFNIKK